MESFRSTLEEVAHADFVLHLVDASDPDVDGRIAAVRGVLAEIDAGTYPGAAGVHEGRRRRRTDPRRPAPRASRRGRRLGPQRSTACPRCSARLGDRLRALTQIVELRIPYERGDVLPALHREGDVLVTVHDDTGVRVRARLPDAVVGRFADLVTAVDGGDGAAPASR